MVAYNDVAVLVELVSISSKHGIHGEGITLGKFETEAHIKVTPRLSLGCHVVTHRKTELINKAYFLHSRRILVRPNLHFQVVRKVELHTTRHCTGRRAIGSATERRISDSGNLSVGIRPDISIIETPPRSTEVRSITERNSRRHHVTNCLYLLAAKPRRRRIETIKFRIGTQRHTEVIDVVETLQCIALHPAILLIPRLHDLGGVHTVHKCKAGSNIDILEYRETGIDGYLVAHTVTPILHQTTLKEKIFLCVDAICERTGVTHANLLVPTFLTSSLLSLERIESVELDIEVRQCNRQTAVAHVLGKVESTA